jgi:hypothetical protein
MYEGRVVRLHFPLRSPVIRDVEFSRPDGQKIVADERQEAAEIPADLRPRREALEFQTLHFRHALHPLGELVLAAKSMDGPVAPRLTRDLLSPVPLEKRADRYRYSERSLQRGLDAPVDGVDDLVVGPGPEPSRRPIDVLRVRVPGDVIPEGADRVRGDGPEKRGPEGGF